MPFQNTVVSRGAMPIAVEILQAINALLANRCVTSPGMAIKAGASALAKSATLFHAVVGGTLVKVAANTDTAAFAGSVTNAKVNVFVHTIDAAGTVRTRMGIEGATRAAAIFPVVPSTETVYGVTVINPTGAGPFVGGTTALDDGAVVPNAEFVSIIGGFAPTNLVF